ncbi:hypothetical protein [Pedobacter sp. MW01-1-1]|uniref:hypothetical protein n=1 Tax=Pedobacter sp. MW01-1-1 TaxID=3383027 RepID=UPI003FEEB420
MKKIIHSSLVLLAAALISACSTTTSITGSYKAPDVTTVKFKKVFVSALTSNASAKQTVETEIAKYLNSKGIATVKSIEVIAPEIKATSNNVDQASVLKKIRDNKCDGILTIALVNKETETRYVPGVNTYPVGGFGYYGTFGGYWGYGYNNFYSPGYYENDKVYYLETNLYDATTEKLVWSAQSQTYNPSSLEDFLPGYQKAITERFIKDGLVEVAKK